MIFMLIYLSKKFCAKKNQLIYLIIYFYGIFLVVNLFFFIPPYVIFPRNFMGNLDSQIESMINLILFMT